jgi:hypothetical protein
MTPLIELLTQARQAGLTLTRIAGARSDEDSLHIRGPRSAEPLVQELLGRKKEVLTTVAIYNGLVTCLDWRKGRILDQPQPCLLCSKKTLLIEPYDGRPCHKSCAEAAIGPGAVPGRRAGGGWAA